MVMSVFKMRWKLVGIIILCLVILILYNHNMLKSTQHKRHHIRPNTFPSNNQITIVTSYFPFKKSKHSSEEYNTWIDNFLSKIETPMIIYTTHAMTFSLSKLRNGAPTFFQTFETIWDIPVLSNLHTAYKEQLELDPESDIHSPELYAVWNSKPWMVHHAAGELNPFNSTYFFWVDIGSFRDPNHPFRVWPDLDRVVQVFGRSDEDNSGNKISTSRPHLFAVQEFPTSLEGSKLTSFDKMSKDSFLIGGFFGGSIEGIKWWSDVFYKTHDLMLGMGFFVGKDQNLMNWIAAQYSNQIFVTCSCDQIQAWKFSKNDCGDPWFYFQYWYANPEERMSDCSVNAKLRNVSSLFKAT